MNCSDNGERKGYDSRLDNMVHRHVVRNVIEHIIILELHKRAHDHDASKFKNPELQAYDKYVPELQKVKYGSAEYDAVKKKMYNEGLKHHYDENRHHPEHFEDGIAGMNLIDFIECCMDWFSASLKSDTLFQDGLKLNAKKYKIPDVLVSMILNTYNDYLKDYETAYNDHTKIVKSFPENDRYPDGEISVHDKLDAYNNNSQYIKNKKLEIYELNMPRYLDDSLINRARGLVSDFETVTGKNY